MKAMMMMMVVLACSVPCLADEGLQAELHKQHQAIRLQWRLPAMQQCDKCNRIAQTWAETMASRERMQHGGGEQVIAMGYRTPQACLNAWMRSCGHRHWLLCRRSCAGFGVARGRSGRYYWAGCFRSCK